MKKPAIPSVNVRDPQLLSILTPMKATLEIMTGVRGDPIPTLASNASLDDVIAKVNSIIERLNA